jgi:quercetin dioxygenase-like cupin family protein
MSVSTMPARRRPFPAALIPIVIAIVALAVLLLLPRLGQIDGRGGATTPAPAASVSSAYPLRIVPTPVTRAPSQVWGNNIEATIPLQRPIQQMPGDGPYVFRVTELEMEPGAKIFPHRQIGDGAHIVMRGSITIDDLEHNTSATYTPGQAYEEAQEPLHQAHNDGKETNRVLMFDILPASRGFDGQQQFTSEGRHNEGEVRSGPYVQMPLRDLPAGPLMLRITDMQFGPKAKTDIHTRLGPAIFFVQEGTATVRKDWDNSSITYGTDGYFYENGKEPFILENKPARPARFLAVEILPQSVGDGPSTVLVGPS